MIKRVYSKIDNKVILNIIYKLESESADASNVKRTEISDQNHAIQAMKFEIPADTEIKAHKHNPQNRVTESTHEAALIFNGSVEISIFDIDNSFVEKTILGPGDCSIIINGGHSFRFLEKTTLFEFKNGPYNGPEKDKTFI